MESLKKSERKFFNLKNYVENLPFIKKKMKKEIN